MTWQNAIELAKRLTKSDSGVQYMGLEVEGTSRLAYQRSDNYIDTAANKASVNNDDMKQVLQVFNAIYGIPGNWPNHPLNNQPKTLVDFAKNKNLAMYATVNKWGQFQVATLDWDVAQYPSFLDQPNKYGMPDEHVNVLTTQSKHKGAAMKVIELLASADVQKSMTSSLGQYTVLKNQDIVSAFGQGIVEIKGKHFQGAFKSTPSPAKPFSELLVQARTIFDNEAMNFFTNGEDINTVIRVSEEQINKLIASQQ